MFLIKGYHTIDISNKGYHAIGVSDTGHRLIVMDNSHAVVYHFTSYVALLESIYPFKLLLVF